MKLKCKHCPSVLELEPNASGEIEPFDCPACGGTNEGPMAEVIAQPKFHVATGPLNPRTPAWLLAIFTLVAVVFVFVAVRTLQGKSVIEQGGRGDEAVQLLVISVVWLVGIIGYFVPTLLAARLKHRNIAAIFALNFCLGWTFIGWVVALVWALVKPSEERPR
jgi:hypothetical protein